MNIKEMIKTVEVFTTKNKPAILTGFSLVGLVSTAWSAYKAGAKGTEVWINTGIKIQKIEDEGRKDEYEAKKEVVIECVKELTPVLLPPIIMGVATGACIIGSHCESARRIATISAAYSISETAIKDLNKKLVDVVGEKKALQVKEAITKEKLKRGEETSPSQSNEVILTGNGDVLCKDLYSGRYFKSNAQKIGEAVNKLSYDLLTDMYVSLNDLYYQLGLPTVPMGDDLGWNIDDVQNGKLPITTTACLTEDGTPCLCVDYDAGLRADFRNLH